jgi:hypothetical protein
LKSSVKRRQARGCKRARTQKPFASLESECIDAGPGDVSAFVSRRPETPRFDFEEKRQTILDNVSGFRQKSFAAPRSKYSALLLCAVFFVACQQAFVRLVRTNGDVDCAAIESRIFIDGLKV